MLDLKIFLEQEGVDAELIDLRTPMTTAEAAANQLNVPVGMIFKSLVLCDEHGQALVAVLSGDKRLDHKMLAKITGSKKLTFADPDVVLQQTGYPAGGTPPFGYPKQLRVIVDESVLGYAKGYCGGGRAELLLHIRPQELIQIAHATVANVSR